MSRFFVAPQEMYEGRQYRFVYDRKYKSFRTVMLFDGRSWSKVKNAGENFYVFFPGFAKNLRETDKLLTWAS